tara:strand:- start:293 stop:1240 length:948 start_codon:yes stop_codon:yes gene_type:complete
MAQILLRSPYYVTVTTASHLSAQLALTIDGTLRYTILKNATSNRTVFEIASLARDYINIVFGGTTVVADTVAISYVITTFTAVDGGGTGTAQTAVTHTGLDGYGTFTFGNNPIIRDEIDPTYVGDCLGNGIIYLPDNTIGKFIGVNSSGVLDVFTIAANNNTTIATPYRTYDIKRVCNPKYTNVKMVYLNRYGMFQEFYFFLKNVESFNTKSETFKRNIFVESSSSYSRYSHQNKTFDKNGRTRVTLNTDYIDECYNEVIQDIMLSEYVWIYFNSVWRPSTISTNSLTFKTSVNDKLIQYTLDLEFANDIINNIV